MLNRKCVPSGKNCGNRCCPSWREASSSMTGETGPPDAETRRMPVEPVEKRIVSPGPHVAGRKSATLAIVCGGPPALAIFFSFPSAKKPTHRLSGDQNGYSAPSVPDSECAATESNDCSHSVDRAPGAAATNTMVRPLGDNSNCGTPTVNAD